MSTTAEFVRANTSLSVPPLVPEIRLHLADGAIALWECTERAAGTELPPPFWAFAWAGGQALARYVLDRPGLVAGRRVLDLASGCGVVAIAAACAGAASVRACDIDPLAIAAIAANAAVNDVEVRADLVDVLDDDGAGAQVVLAGDVFYSREMAVVMLAFLDRVAARGATVLVGDPGRAYLPRNRFEELARFDVPVTRDLEDADRKPTAVLALRRP
jgi:predicted nicotinamide N-methyase